MFHSPLPWMAWWWWFCHGSINSLIVIFTWVVISLKRVWFKCIESATLLCKAPKTGFFTIPVHLERLGLCRKGGLILICLDVGVYSSVIVWKKSIAAVNEKIRVWALWSRKLAIDLREEWVDFQTIQKVSFP